MAQHLARLQHSLDGIRLPNPHTDGEWAELIGELIARRNLPQASRVGAATFLGFLAGTVAKIACAFAMLGVFILALLF